MRKPRDYDNELQALTERTKLLRDRKLTQLGELVVATGADALPIELLAGALLAATNMRDAGTKGAWQQRGAAFFQRSQRGAAASDKSGVRGGAAGNGSAKPPATNTGSA